MHRTQISLDDEEVALLARESARTGASRSELIRRAVRSQYGVDTPEGRLAALRDRLLEDPGDTTDAAVTRLPLASA